MASRCLSGNFLLLALQKFWLNVSPRKSQCLQGFSAVRNRQSIGRQYADSIPSVIRLDRRNTISRWGKRFGFAITIYQQLDHKPSADRFDLLFGVCTVIGLDNF